ncbi:MAG: RNA polymerase sigma factor [Chthoniobacterales bacterium]
MNSLATDPITQNGVFHSTRWTLVLAAGGAEGSPSQSLEALSELCRIYWRPLYLFLRREGISSADAQDLTQGFFAKLIRDRTCFRADRAKGRFRSFLLGALKHFVADARRRDRAQKRGGGKFFESLEESELREVEAQVAAAERWNPDALYEREWAAALLRQTLDRLAQECAIAGKTPLFEGLRAYLPATGDKAVPYEEISRQLHRGAGTLRSDVSRLRMRYRAILREEVRGTVAEASEVDDELRYLCQVIAQT